MSRLTVRNVTADDLLRMAKERGYAIQPKRGKGSHIVLTKEGCPNLTIPGGKFIGKNVARRMIKIILAA